MTARTALEDVEIDGNDHPQGSTSYHRPWCGERDPAQFPDPDRPRPSRAKTAVTSLSVRAFHHCLGAPLARVEAQIAINTLLRRMPALWLQSEDLEWREDGDAARAEGAAGGVLINGKVKNEE